MTVAHAPTRRTLLLRREPGGLCRMVGVTGVHPHVGRIPHLAERRHCHGCGRRFVPGSLHLEGDVWYAAGTDQIWCETCVQFEEQS